MGDWCSFAFTGTGVKWIGSKNANHGAADIYLDGKLDATVSTASPVWLKKQELYARAGLGAGPHTLKVVIKTEGYQDVDAFEVERAPAKLLAQVSLPPQMPYLNEKHRYPVASGVGIAVGETDGSWSMLFGPGYTSSNLLYSEVLTMEIDGVVTPLQMEMHRAAKTGIFYGTQTIGDLNVRLVDFTVRDAPWISRTVLIDNVSPTDTHDVRLRAEIQPADGRGISGWFLCDAQQDRCGLVIRGGPDAKEPNNQLNSEDKVGVIAFAEATGIVSRQIRTYTLESGIVHIPPASSGHLSLCHYFRRDDRTDLQCLAAIRGLDPVARLKESVAEWQRWLGDVPAPYQLDKIADARARQLVEGALVIMRMNECSDGGIIAHTTYYLEGYVRDACLALRGFAATGHFAESKKWLLWFAKDLDFAGHLDDAWLCGTPMTLGSDPFQVNVEEPAYVLICAREYYRGTHDLDCLNSIRKALQYCMDVQLEAAIQNDDRLGFNGDETEAASGLNTDPSGYNHSGWSYASIGMAAASLDFYIEYLRLNHDDPTKYACFTNGTTIDLTAELAKMVKAMDRDFWRTDVPEISGGFHDFYLRNNGSRPLKRIVNFTLIPIFNDCPYDLQEQKKDIDAMAHYFNPATGFLQLVPGADTGFDGHDLGYLLWSLAAIGDPREEEVYKALVNGPTADAWGSFSEAYDATGHPNTHDLRSLETGVNVSAIAKYWGLGPASK